MALDLCTSDWILLLDADEVLYAGAAKGDSPAAGRRARSEPKYGAYWIPRRNLILGRWMRHGGFYPDLKLRLFKRGAARLDEGVGPHSTPQFAGPRGRLKHDMLHYAYPDLNTYLEHMNRYSSRNRCASAQRRPREPIVSGIYLECGAESGARRLSITTFSGSVFSMAAKGCCCT